MPPQPVVAPETPQHAHSTSNEQIMKVVGLALLVAFVPTALIVAGIALFAFGILRLRVRALVAGFLTGTAIDLVFGQLSSAGIHRYLAPEKALMGSLSHKSTGGPMQLLSQHWPAYIGDQIWLAVPLGLGFGAIYAAWRWTGRAPWLTEERPPGPIDALRRKSAIGKLQAGTVKASNGCPVGVDQHGRIVVIDNRELAAGMVIAGGSGSGKTTTLMILASDAIQRGLGVCMLDLKGSPQVAEHLANEAARHGRRFWHWRIGSGHSESSAQPCHYDPLSRGDSGRRADLLAGAFGSDNQFYADVEANYLQIAMRVAMRCPPSKPASALMEAAALTNPVNLEERVQDLEDSKDPNDAQLFADVIDLVHGMSREEMGTTRHVSHTLASLLRSPAGRYLSPDPTDSANLDLARALRNGDVVCFSLDSAIYEKLAPKLGALIVQDLKTITGELRQSSSSTPVRVMIDEFASLGQSNLLGLSNKARDAGMEVILATQALADLMASDHTFQDQILAIVGSFAVHRANTEQDARVFAGLSGVSRGYSQTHTVETSMSRTDGIVRGSPTGRSVVSETEKYNVDIGDFQNLKQGEIVLIAKTPKTRVVHHVLCVPANPQRPFTRRVEEPKSEHKELPKPNMPSAAKPREPENWSFTDEDETPEGDFFGTDQPEDESVSESTPIQPSSTPKRVPWAPAPAPPTEKDRAMPSGIAPPAKTLQDEWSNS